MRVLATVATSLALVAATALPAVAETIYLKNGTRVEGRIVKEDAETFQVETKEGRRKIPKRDIEVVPAPEPFIALMTGLLLPGGGQLYIGDYPRAGFYLGLGAASAAVGWVAASQIRYNSPSTSAVTAVVMMMVPGVIGAFDAAGASERLRAQTRYRIDYTK
ncbi:MAG: LA_0442/LA_0875 N-terminal domain-containing protein [Candidatus Sericytochromatia bacterium]